MNWMIICRMLGYLALNLGGLMALSLPFAFPWTSPATEFETKGCIGLLTAMGICAVVGGVLLWLGRHHKNNVLHKEAMAIVALGWLMTSLLGGLPYLFAGVETSPGQPITVVDAFFETVSGFTTTGASIIAELENPETLPRCILHWRCFTHWIGGIGIVVLYVVILNSVGSSSKAVMQREREISGPLTQAVHPRVKETATILSWIYLLMTLLFAGVYLLQGMSVYDALCHSYATLGTGGFSTYNSSVGHFNSAWIEMTMVVFMIASCFNFLLYYVLYKKRVPGQGVRNFLAPLFNDAETRAFMAIVVTATTVVSINSWMNGIYPDYLTSLRHTLFVVSSLISTTGFCTQDYNQWSQFAQAALLFIMIIGGCTGSTAGGLKVIRFILFYKIIFLEIEKTFLPNIVRSLRMGGQALSDSLRHDVVIHVAMMMVVLITGSLVMMAIEPDTMWTRGDVNHLEAKLQDCGSAVLTCFSNVGPGIGVFGPMFNFSQVSDAGKVVLSAVMLIGRLEMFAILVLLVPSFWKD